MSLLLVNQADKDKYDKLMIDIIKLKNDLLKKLNGLSKVKKDDLE
jgi:hypothetical protein